jgi:hypothetical protein
VKGQKEEGIMEIDITRFVKTVDACEFSASQMELGKDAGKITWNNAKREAADSPLLPDDAVDVFKSWVREFGAWDDDEINAWDADERNALLIQYISGDLRELESLCYSDDDEYGIDWTKAEELASRGTIGGRIYRGDDDRLYFDMS